MLTALLLLGVAIGLAVAGGKWPIAEAVAIVAAAWAATTLPDLDMMSGLGHRSGLTHSVLPVALAGLRPQWRAIATGLALGIGLHLSADLFPNAMRGFAMIKLPGFGSLGASASYGWIAVNAAAALLIGTWLLGRCLAPKLAIAVLGAVALIGIVYLFTTDGGWWALAMFGGAGWLAFRGPAERRAG